MVICKTVGELKASLAVYDDSLPVIVGDYDSPLGVVALFRRRIDDGTPIAVVIDDAENWEDDPDDADGKD